MTRKRYEPNPLWLDDGLRLLQAIKISGMTQKGFALAMGVSPSDVSRWTGGRASFRDHFIRKRAVDVLACTMRQLDGDDPFSYAQRKKQIDYSLNRAGIRLETPASGQTLYAHLMRQLAQIGYDARGGQGSFTMGVRVRRADETTETARA